MAATEHIHFSCSILDAQGVRTSKTSQLVIDPVSSVSALQTAINSWLGTLDPIIEGQIVRASVGLPITVPVSLKNSPQATSEVDEVVVFDMNQVNLATHYGDVVPSFIHAGLSGDKVDLQNAAVLAYVGLLGTAVLGGNYSGLGNEALTGLYRAFQGTRTHRKQLFGKSVTYP